MIRRLLTSLGFTHKFELRNIHTSAKVYNIQRAMQAEGAGVELSKVLEVLEDFAPKKLSESWDNTGLLLEPYTPRRITNILLTNDLTEAVVSEVPALRCEMIISYHPPIFAPLKSVTQRSWKERIVSVLLEQRVALYSPHTSWDSVTGGVNDWLASCLPHSACAPVLPSTADPVFGAGRILKLDPSIALSDAVERVKALTGLKYVRLALGVGRGVASEVKTVALCAGSGASVLKGVEADLYVTGEMLHHDVLDATQRGVSVILTNHSDSERGFLRVFQQRLTQLLGGKVAVHVSTNDRDPLDTV